MDIEKTLKKNSKIANFEIRKFLPKKFNVNWVVRNIGPGAYDLKAFDEVLTKPVWDMLERGGKRWRPLLLSLACGVVGGNAKATAKFGVVVELLHNGSLIEDDVEDQSLTRRNKPAIHVIYGTDVAINLSHTLYNLPMRIIKDSTLSKDKKIQIYEMINRELTRLHFGQGTDIYWHKLKNQNVSERQYISMCANKTGTLARLTAQLGAILGNGTKEQVLALGKFAEAIGIAFQIQDDILNLSGNIGKDFGEDITEGKMSLPVIQTLSVASSQDRKMLMHILKKHPREKAEINRAIKLINKYNSLTYSRNVADRIIRRAWSKVNPLLENSEAKDSLQQLSKFMLERKH